MSNQPDIGLILNYWEELIECARNEYVFDEPLDAELFRKCIKRSYEYFLSKGEATTSFDILEVELYARIYAYSIIPAVTLGENTAVFAASTGVAAALADMIVNGILDDGIISKNCFIDDQPKSFIYDVNKGDLSDYIEAARMGLFD